MIRQVVNLTCWGTVAACLVGPTVAGAADPWVVAAQKREETLRSAEIEFRLVEFYTKGGIPTPPLPGVKPGNPMPTNDQTVESTNRIVIDGDKVRYEDNRPLWNVPAGAFIAKGTVGVGNGDKSRAFCPDGIGRYNRRMGVVTRTAEAKGINFVGIAAITFNLRSLQPTISPYFVKELKPSGLTQPVGGHSCQEYTIAYSPTSSLSVWLDPKCDYVARRIRHLLSGRVFHQMDVTFMADPSVGWRPSSWTWTKYDPAGRVMRSCNGAITSFKANPIVPTSTFELTFPEGTLVHDQRDGKNYMVLPDGNWQQTSVSGEPVGSSIAPIGSSWARKNRWLLIGSAVLGVLAVIGAWHTWRRRSSRTTALSGA